MNIELYFRRAFGLGFDAYKDGTGYCLDVYLGPLTIEFGVGPKKGQEDARDPAAGECQHSWSNWTEPARDAIAVPSMFGGSVERQGLLQERHCLKCNFYQRHLA